MRAAILCILLEIKSTRTHMCPASACLPTGIAQSKLHDTPDGDRKHLRPSAPASSKPCSCSGSPEFCGVRPPHMPTSTCSLPCAAAKCGGYRAMRHTHGACSAQPGLRIPSGSRCCSSTYVRPSVSPSCPCSCTASSVHCIWFRLQAMLAAVLVAAADADLGRFHLLTQKRG